MTLALISNIANYLKYNYFWGCDGIDNVTLRLCKFSDFCSRHIVGVAGDDIMFHILVHIYSGICQNTMINDSMFDCGTIKYKHVIRGKILACFYASSGLRIIVWLRYFQDYIFIVNFNKTVLLASVSGPNNIYCFPTSIAMCSSFFLWVSNRLLHTTIQQNQW